MKRKISKTFVGQCLAGIGLIAGVTSAAADQTPYGGTPAPVPGTIEAEHFDGGGEGVAYHDVDGGVFIGGVKYTGAYVGNTRTGEWIEYTINVQNTSDYMVEVQVNSVGVGGSFHVEFDGTPTQSLNIPDTGAGRHSWVAVANQGVHLTAGVQVMRVMFDSVGPSGSAGNIDWIRITPAVASIPGVIEAERFDDGADNVAYHDSDATNNGGYYRFTRVDIDRYQFATGPFYDHESYAYYIGWTEAGEWLTYTVNVQTDGIYEVRANIASQGVGGTFHIEFDGVDRTGPFSVPDTGDWRRFAVLAKGGVSLTAGVHTVRVVMDSVGPSGSVANIDWIEFALQTGSKQPYNYSPLFYYIEAENFDQGGEGVGYHDSDAVNHGGFYRATGVDIDRGGEFNIGYYIGWTKAGEWLEYTVTVGHDAYYLLGAVVASDGQGGQFHIEIDGADKTGALSIPDTGGWRNWTSVGPNSAVWITAGAHVLRVALDSNGASGSVGNIDRLRFEPVFRGVTDVTADTVIDAERFDSGGEGIAYHDNDAVNHGVQLRSEGVDIDFDPNTNNFYVGWTEAGEWLEYSLFVEQAGFYIIDTRVASLGQGGVFHLEFDRVDLTGPIGVPDTGDWRNWTVVGRRVYLNSGPVVMRIALDSIGPSGSVGNIDMLHFVRE